MEPEHVERDLPKAVDIARKAGLATPMLITAIIDAQSPRAEAILDTMRSFGIRRYRAPSFRYDYKGDLNQQWEALKPRVASLVKLNEKYGTTAMYHTHSGPWECRRRRMGSLAAGERLRSALCRPQLRRRARYSKRRRRVD